ncbi:hypothetical protein BCR34DRAFT_672355 [Clohesyomyces aquaticus]|uniref:Alpha-type protein kinase domain-containing protein n=1 Tax=Clohesyomyces aquaticus TaxID=1231657 RepID=A0A1Y1ZYW4_9PLEO|nr:hypothetical protein BCR34DRAFT_672355 [Clohesyomyces aquaticus]
MTLISSSRTGERPQDIERERGELRQGMEGETNVTNRLKREIKDPSDAISSAEANRRILQLKLDMKAAGKETPSRSTAGLFKSVCSTDLLFLIDTTMSMQPHIDAAKDQVRSILKDIEESFYMEAEVRMAVVGYKDHDDIPSIQFLDFTPNVDHVRSAIDDLVAEGGDDIPEDVLGGLRQALHTSWKNKTRCIIHIADAPPHGRTLQNTIPNQRRDNYPEPGSEPHGLTHEALLHQMIALNINYALLRINHSTDRMAFEFMKAYADVSADCKLLRSNRFYPEARTFLARRRSGYRGRSSKSSSEGGLVFEEFELGTKFSALHHLVIKMVTTSASRTAVRETSTPSTKIGVSKKVLDLASIKEDEGASADVDLEDCPPQWDTRGWFEDTLVVEGFSPDVAHGASTLDNMMAEEDNFSICTTQLTIHKRQTPFAQGAMRVAFYARTAESMDPFVVKLYKKDGKDLPHLAEDMRSQALCKAFALEFNALSGKEIDFIVTTCLKGKPGGAGLEEVISLEPFLSGDYVKYNNNAGWVNEDIPVGWKQEAEAAQAFSHFTFERSRGRFLVSDIQGVGRILTDPAIHTRDRHRFKLAGTNLNTEGFKLFFLTHVCNDVCRKLGLVSNKSMLTSGSYQFRETWPSVGNTVCCSNKLCGRIVRLRPIGNSSSLRQALFGAKHSDRFPGCYWCHACFPQLESSIVKLTCEGPGPGHEFQVSKFFHESQGRVTPRECLMHREDDGVSKGSVSGRNLRGVWKKMKFATKKKAKMSKAT